jgi:hypothetical protein
MLDEFFFRDSAYEENCASGQSRDAEHHGQCPDSEVRKPSRRNPCGFRNRQGHW